MSTPVARIAAIVRADMLIRFRRASTLVIFLLLGAFAYVWIPDPSSGQALMVIDNQRAVYNSAAIALGTATIATFFVGLVGFYVVSNALARDVSSRCGFVIASTTMRGSEYLIGKFAGNVVFLTTFIAGFMVSSMAMLIVRGEAPLQPLVFAKQYLLVVPPMIVFVSALAIVFESVPLLSGKFGDVAYFFVWSGILGAVVAMIETGHGVSVARYFDFIGFGYMLDQMKTASHTTHFSIGSSGFDPSKPTFVFDGLQLGRTWILPRLVSAVLPVSSFPSPGCPSIVSIPLVSGALLMESEEAGSAD